MPTAERAGVQGGNPPQTTLRDMISRLAFSRCPNSGGHARFLDDIRTALLVSHSRNNPARAGPVGMSSLLKTYEGCRLPVGSSRCSTTHLGASGWVRPPARMPQTTISSARSTRPGRSDEPARDRGSARHVRRRIHRRHALEHHAVRQHRSVLDRSHRRHRYERGGRHPGRDTRGGRPARGQAANLCREPRVANVRGPHRERLERMRARVARWQRTPHHVLAISAVVGLPPFSIMATAAGVLAIRLRSFCAVVFVGRATRFAIVIAITALASR